MFRKLLITFSIFCMAVMLGGGMCGGGGGGGGGNDNLDPTPDPDPTVQDANVDGVWSSNDMVALVSGNQLIGVTGTTAGDIRMVLNDPHADVKIVGGHDTTIEEFPSTAYFPQLNPDGSILGHCDASYIGGGWAVSAAHCVVDTITGEVVSPASLVLAFGFTNKQNILTGGTPPATYVPVGVVNIVPNPFYNAETYENDIALLELTASPANIPPAKIYQGNDVAPGTLVTPVGWGNTQFSLEEGSTNLADILQEVKVPIVDRNLCLNQLATSNFSNNIAITNSVVCAGVPQGGLDSCQGDSGGPLYIQQGWDTKQVGIVSSGVGCALPELPGIYTFIPAFEDWIESTVGFNVIGDDISDGDSIAVNGNLSISGNNYTFNGTGYDINFNNTTPIQDQGTVTEASVIAGNFNLGSNNMYNNPSSLVFLDGDWEILDSNNNPLIELNVAGGSISGVDANECTYSGNIGLIDTSKNLYNASLVENCINGSRTYAGLATIGDVRFQTVEGQRTLYMFVANNTSVKPLYLSLKPRVIEPVPEPDPIPVPDPTPDPVPDPIPDPDPTPDPDPVPVPDPEPDLGDINHPILDEYNTDYSGLLVTNDANQLDEGGWFDLTPTGSRSVGINGLARVDLEGTLDFVASFNYFWPWQTEFAVTGYVDTTGRMTFWLNVDQNSRFDGVVINDNPINIVIDGQWVIRSVNLGVTDDPGGSFLAGETDLFAPQALDFSSGSNGGTLPYSGTDTHGNDVFDLANYYGLYTGSFDSPTTTFDGSFYFVTGDENILNINDELSVEVTGAIRPYNSSGVSFFPVRGVVMSDGDFLLWDLNNPDESFGGHIDLHPFSGNTLTGVCHLDSVHPCSMEGEVQ